MPEGRWRGREGETEKMMNKKKKQKSDFDTFRYISIELFNSNESLIDWLIDFWRGNRKSAALKHWLSNFTQGGVVVGSWTHSMDEWWNRRNSMTSWLVFLLFVWKRRRYHQIISRWCADKSGTIEPKWVDCLSVRFSVANDLATLFCPATTLLIRSAGRTVHLKEQLIPIISFTYQCVWY